MTYLVPTRVAATALDITPEQFEKLFAAGVITPADTAPGAARLWDVDKLRHQVQRHVGRGHGESASR